MNARVQSGINTMKGMAKGVMPHLSTASGCLQLFHILFAFLTIVGLNMSNISADLKISQKKFELIPSLKEWCKNVKKEDELNYYKCRFYCAGAIWALFAGILGICSLLMLGISLMTKLGKILMVIYYFASAFVIFLIALIGLCYNQVVEQYIDCLRKKDVDLCIYANFFGFFYFVMFSISCIHAMLYFVSGLIELGKQNEAKVQQGDQYDYSQQQPQQSTEPQVQPQQWTQPQPQPSKQWTQPQAQKQQWNQAPQAQQQWNQAPQAQQQWNQAPQAQQQWAPQQAQAQPQQQWTQPPPEPQV